MDMQKILEYRNARNRFCQRIGITVTELSPGYAKVVKTVTEDDLNPVDVAHGGLFFSMADNAAGSAMAAYGEQAVTLNAQYNFMRAAKAGDVLTAEAREAKHGGTVCVFDIRITDQDGNLDGTGTFTFYNPEKAPEDSTEQKRSAPKSGQTFYLAYFLKLSFRLTLRLNTGWPALVSLLSRQK